MIFSWRGVSVLSAPRRCSSSSRLICFNMRPPFSLVSESPDRDFGALSLAVSEPRGDLGAPDRATSSQLGAVLPLQAPDGLARRVECPDFTEGLASFGPLAPVQGPDSMADANELQ